MAPGVCCQVGEGALGVECLTAHSGKLKVVAKGDESTLRLDLTLAAKGAASQVDAHHLGIKGLLGTGLGTPRGEGLVAVLVDGGEAAVSGVKLDGLLGIFAGAVALFPSVFDYLEHLCTSCMYSMVRPYRSKPQ